MGKKARTVEYGTWSRTIDPGVIPRRGGDPIQAEVRSFNHRPTAIDPGRFAAKRLARRDHRGAPSFSSRAFTSAEAAHC